MLYRCVNRLVFYVEGETDKTERESSQLQIKFKVKASDFFLEFLPALQILAVYE